MEQVSPLLAGIPISNRFAEKLGITQEQPTEKPIQEEDKFQVVGNQIQELEMKVNQQLEELKQGWERLPGMAGKRDDDPSPPVIEKLIKQSPNLIKNNPSILEKYEIYLRRIKKLPEEEIEKQMNPLWMNYLNNTDPQPKDERYERIPEQTGVKKTTEADPLLSAVEKLAGMIEGMNKPKTIIRDANGKITGVA